MKPWRIYEALQREIPDEARVRRCLVGRGWTLVEAEGDQAAVGMAMTHRADVEAALPLPIAGKRLKDVAALARSWNVEEAAVGVAALNAHHNARARVETMFRCQPAGSNTVTAFAAMEKEIAGCRVAVVGHFHRVEDLAKSCTLTVLERKPQPGDLPDFAAEYVLPDQEYVFITGVTLVNKTLPRLLELCRRARVILVGPSVPLSPILFDFGVAVLGGTVVLDPAGVWAAAQEGGVHEIWRSGAVTVQLRPEDATSHAKPGCRLITLTQARGPSG